MRPAQRAHKLFSRAIHLSRLYFTPALRRGAAVYFRREDILLASPLLLNMAICSRHQLILMEMIFTVCMPRALEGDQYQAALVMQASNGGVQIIIPEVVLT